MQFLIDNKIVSKYPRKDISEPIEGRKDKVYVIVDDIPTYNNLSQIVQKVSIDKTDEIYNNHEHLYIAYQRYNVVNLPDEIAIQNIKDKFANWIDKNYPIWKRQKHLTELTQRNPGQSRKGELEDWINWEFTQRDKLEQKISNKNFTFDFETKK